MTSNHVDETQNPCPCRGCTTSRQEERASIIANIEKFRQVNDVGVQAINFAYDQIIKLLKENKL
jgi:hypothetical protein